MAGAILFCFAIGYYLDKWLHTKGLFIIIFILLGVAGGGYTAYRQIMGIVKPHENGRKQDKNVP
jgi:ATP synthase protein I